MLIGAASVAALVLGAAAGSGIGSTAQIHVIPLETVSVQGAPVFRNHREIGLRFDGLSLSYGVNVSVRIRCTGCNGKRARGHRFLTVARLRGEVIPPHAILDIRATRPGTVGRYIKLVNAGSATATIREELCLPAGSTRPSACSPTKSIPTQPTVTAAPTTTTTTIATTYFSEQQGSLGAPTFKDPHNATGEGPRVVAMATVEVTCKVLAPEIASANPDGYWYRLHSAPWQDLYYAVANTFENGDVPGQSTPAHNTDFRVPDC